MDDETPGGMLQSAAFILVGLAACIVAICASGALSAFAIGAAAVSLVGASLSDTPEERFERECRERQALIPSGASEPDDCPEIEPGGRWQQAVATSRGGSLGR